MRAGPGYRFRTEVLAVGTRAGTVWHGDLFLKGHGDPTSSQATSIAWPPRSAGPGSRASRAGSAATSPRTTAAAVRRGNRGFVGIETPPLSALVVDRARGFGPAKPPPLLAARALRAALLQRGVDVAGPSRTGSAPSGAVTLAVDRSAPLTVIVRSMNADSDNFTAEMVLKQLGTLSGGVGTSAAGASWSWRGWPRPGSPCGA